MFKELINTLSFMYTYAARSRGKLGKEELEGLQSSAHTMAYHAPAVLAAPDAPLTADDKIDLEEAQLLDDHISEMVDWLIRLEIV